MPYPNEHAARIRDPGLFIPTSFRSKNITTGVRIIVGRLKGETSMIVQAYRFSVDNFTEEEAKKWLEDHKVTFMKFEPADQEELKHIGVMGMRWGHRKASTSSADHMKVLGLKKKKLHEMSNEEIRTLTTRMQLETQYRSLNPSKITRGKRVVGGTVSMLGKVVATAGTISAAAALGKKVYEYAMGRAVARAFTK